MVQSPVTKPLFTEFEERFAKSKALFERERMSVAGGIAHDGRYSRPFPIYVESADGSHKKSVEGYDLIDYAMGHGALILGHNDPDIARAVMEQYPKGTHYGACHDLEAEWAEAIVRLVPSADRVRFTASGTEATLLAMRLARSYTGRPVVAKFAGHFHGWNDYAVVGERPPFDAQIPGIPAEVHATCAILPYNDPEALDARLGKGDVACLILEPSGGSWAKVPTAPGFLEQVREITTRHDVVLIFDEVITGFRWAPGGAQDRFKITPDMSTMAKCVAGGLPGGAVAGRGDIMALLEFRDDPEWMATKKVGHPGTYNANPLAAAAGVAALKKIANPAVQAHCDRIAGKIRAGMNAALVHYEVPGAVWGESSAFHVMVGTPVKNRTAADMHTPEGVTHAQMKASPKSGLGQHVYLGLLMEGVDLFGGGGMTSLMHTDADADYTVKAFERVLGRLVDEGLVD